jgi:uncharacterized protein YfaS (alpha-2-macroglobulin family)
MAIRGLFGLIMFTDQDLIQSVIIFSSEKYSETLSIPTGLDLPAGTWHTEVSLVDDSILFEVKN